MNNRALTSLIQAIRRHAEKILTRAKDLRIWQSEMEPNDGIAFFAHLQAQEDLFREAANVAGHLLMVQEYIRTNRCRLSADVRKSLKRSATILKSVSF